MTAPAPNATRKRDCGSCTLCCKLLHVEEIAKRPNVWCEHCEKGRGCRIYETRPASCRTFNCLWLTDPTVDERLKPERSKVVLGLSEENGELIAFVDTAYPDAWRNEPMMSLLKRATRRFRVIVYVGERVVELPQSGAGTVRVPL